jgi:outer membrane lipoprotein-sorting protein
VYRTIKLHGGEKMVEKSKKWAIILVGLLFIGFIASAGCIGEKAPEEGEEVPTGEATTPTAEASTATSGDEGTSLSDLLAKAKGTTSVKYDMVSTSPGKPSETAKVWMEGNKMRMEATAEGETMIIIVNELEAYMYNPEENMALKMDFSDVPESTLEDIDSLMDYKPTVVGVDTVDGKLCTVVEYTYSSEISGDNYELKTKSWLWQKHGLPIRTETTSSFGGTSETTTTEMKNIDFGDIPNSMFELPAGVEIQDFQSMMESMQSDGV